MSHYLHCEFLKLDCCVCGRETTDYATDSGFSLPQLYPTSRIHSAFTNLAGSSIPVGILLGIVPSFLKYKT